MRRPVGQGFCRVGDEQVAGGNGMAVLIVDDEPGVRKLLRAILARAGFTCVEAADGESGLKLAAEAGVSAAVVDLLLPGISGAELAWRLKQMRPDLHVIAVSGHLDLWDADDLLDLGIREVLPKPFEPGKLIQAVANGITSSERIGPARPCGRESAEKYRTSDRAGGGNRRGAPSGGS